MDRDFHPRHTNSFSFIRSMLAVSVIFGHSFDMAGRHDPLVSTCPTSETSFGGVGVDGFFLLSGFLITASFLADPRPWRYLGKRIRRIYPGFVVAYTLSVFVVGPMAADGSYFSNQNWKSLAVSLVTLNAPNQVLGVFVNNPSKLVNGPLWTIRFEFACYIMVLGLGMIGLLRRPRLVLTLAVMMTIAFVVQYQVWDRKWGSLRVQQQFYPIPRLVCLFLVGSAIQLHREWLQVRTLWLFLAALGYFVSLAHPWTYRTFSPWLGGIALLGLGSRTSLMGRWFETLPDVSYGMYLYAYPIQNLLIAYISRQFGVTFGVALVLSVLAGLASWYGVERRWVRSKRKPQVGGLLPLVGSVRDAPTHQAIIPGALTDTVEGA